MKYYFNSYSYMPLASLALLEPFSWGMWERRRESSGGREPEEGSWGIACYILFTASQWHSIEGGSCVLLSLLERHGGRGGVGKCN